jgi:hypothetical protein
MDIIFIIFPVFGIIFSVIMAMAWLDSTKRGEGLDPALGYFILVILSISVLSLTWACVSQCYHNPTPSISFHPIEEFRSIPFYINEEGRPVEVTGEAKFADPKSSQFKITIVPGGWKFCMYVTESRKVELVKKNIEIINNLEKN